MNSDRRESQRIRWLLALLGGVAIASVFLSSWLKQMTEDMKATVEAHRERADVLEVSPGVVLSDEKQKHIWDVEHATFELETFFGKAFQEAIRKRDSAFLAGMLTDSASIELLPQSDVRVRQIGPVAESRIDAATVALNSSNAVGLAEGLLGAIATIDQITGTRFRVLELDTSDGQTWKSRILLECSGLTVSQERRVLQSNHAIEFQFAAEEDIRTGKIISAWRDESRSSRRSDQILMEEITESTGLTDLPLYDNWKLKPSQASQYWFQMAVADFNKDGFPDIAVAPFYGTPLLLRSKECEQFVNVAREMGIQPWKVDGSRLLNLATWIDFDDDGWLDLLLGERLYRNIEGHFFEDVTDASGLHFGHHAMGSVVADYDCDGLADLYVLYQYDPTDPPPPGPKPWVGDTESGAKNQLWHNEGGGRFRDVTAESNTSGGSRESFTAVWHFLDSDRFPDLYIANDFGQNVHLRNRGNGTFEDVSADLGTADFATSMGACAGDLNNDGRPELYVANMYSKMGRRIINNVADDDYPPGIYQQILGSCAGNRLYTAAPGSLQFHEVSEEAGVNEVGWAYAPTMADFNSDGLLDIYATTGFMSFNRKKPDG
jgi:FG-GAP-like repeat/FG-GAP repeat